MQWRFECLHSKEYRIFIHLSNKTTDLPTISLIQPLVKLKFMKQTMNIFSFWPTKHLTPCTLTLLFHHWPYTEHTKSIFTIPEFEAYYLQPLNKDKNCITNFFSRTQKRDKTTPKTKTPWTATRKPEIPKRRTRVPTTVAPAPKEEDQERR